MVQPCYYCYAQGHLYYSCEEGRNRKILDNRVDDSVRTSTTVCPQFPQMRFFFAGGGIVDDRLLVLGDDMTASCSLEEPAGLEHEGNGSLHPNL